MELEQRQGWFGGAADSLLVFEGAGAAAPKGPIQRWRPPTKTFRLRPDYVALAYDALICWDMLAILATAWACTAVSRHIGVGSGLDLHLSALQGSLPLIGALLAPLVLYEPRSGSRPSNAEKFAFRAGAVVLRVAVLFGLLVAIGALTSRLQGQSAKWLLAWFASTAATILAGRGLLARLLVILKRHGILREHVAVVGAGSLATQLVATLRARPDAGIEIAGVFDDAAGPQVSGTVQDLIELGKSWPIDRLVVAAPAYASAGLVSRLMALDAEIVACSEPAGLALARTGAAAEPQLIPLVRRPLSGWTLVQKTVVDKVLGVLLLLAALPAMGLIALAIRLESPGPVIFRQRRHGWNNTEFDVLKFRTMLWRGNGLANGAKQTMRDDPRMTRLGRVLRKTSLDELPQLLNVLRGEMSLVGPRPHPVVMRTEGRLCGEILAEYGQRHRVKPGLTGWAQVNGSRGATETAEEVRRRVAYDIAYIEQWSLLLDLKILALTPWRLISSGERAF